MLKVFIISVMMKSATILLCAFIFFVKVSSPAAEEELPRGQIIELVRCTGSSSQTYTLYLPSYYTEERSWPIIYGFSPGGDGAEPVRLLKSTAEKYGYILAGSNNARNGPWPPIYEATQAVLEDTEARLNLHSDRRYAVGFSGGARMSFAMVNKYPKKFRGVIPCGAGFGEERGCPSHILVYALCGQSDGNMGEMKLVVEKLGYPKDPKIRFEPFDGGHEWPSEWLLDQALLWMDQRYALEIADDMARVLRIAEESLKIENEGEAYRLLREYLGCYSLPHRKEAQELLLKVQLSAEDTKNKMAELMDLGEVARFEALYKKSADRFKPHPMVQEFKKLYENLPNRMIEQAGRRQQDGKVFSAYQLYEAVLKSFPGSPQSLSARDRMAELEKDPETFGIIEKEKEKKKAMVYLKKALHFLEQKKYGSAWVFYQKIEKECPKSTMRDSVELGLEKIDQVADEYFEKAKKLFDEKKYQASLDQYRWIARSFAGSVYGDQANQTMEIIKKDPAVTAYFQSKQDQDAADGLWQMANNFYEAGDPDGAREYFQELIDKYPNSDYAEKSRERLKDFD